VNRDPIRYASKDINLFRIVFNMTLITTDPQGLEPPIYAPTTRPTNPIVTGHGCTGWSCGRAGPMGPMDPRVQDQINNPPPTGDPLGEGPISNGKPLPVGQQSPMCKLVDVNPLAANLLLTRCIQQAEDTRSQCKFHCKWTFPTVSGGLGALIPGAVPLRMCLGAAAGTGGVAIGDLCYAMCDCQYSLNVKLCQEAVNNTLTCCPK
jgi:hypothetical protein